jgi:hypothetical protein
LIDPQLTPFEWAVQHIQLIGWPSVLVVVWKMTKFLTKLEDRALDAEKNLRVVAESNIELKSALEGQVQAQRELANGVHQLAEAMSRQSEMHAEQLGLIRDMQTKQEVLAANQTALMGGLQRVIEQLINAVKG